MTNSEDNGFECPAPVDITLLCRVVDNFGDIGVVYRLARALSEAAGAEHVSLRLVVDDLQSFSMIAPGIDPAAAVQDFNGWTVYKWSSGVSGAARNSAATAAFVRKPPHVILECFACGRPDWLEDILFAPDFGHIVHIINLEYLTAEPYADEFHKLKSLTRSAKIQKVNFMPGFTENTGGLILDRSFMREVRCTPGNTARCPDAVPAGNGAPADQAAGSLPVVVFSYERDFAPVVSALARFNTVVFLAAGKSRAPFLSAWNAAGQPFEVRELSFLPQQEWDALLCRCSFLFVRGEDSLSRACLSGVPFVWHAYPQSEQYQLVKVQALLDRMRPFFNPEDFLLLEKYWLLYNGAAAHNAGLQPYVPCLFGQADYDAEMDMQERLLVALLQRLKTLQTGFSAFSRMLQKNGNLALHLMTFISEIV